MLSRNRIGLHTAAAVCFVFAAILSNGHAFGQTKANIEILSSEHSGEFSVAVNKSQILRLDVPFTDLLVGNSKIADVVPLTNRTIYVLGKQIGSTSLSIYGTSKRLIAVLDLMVTHDIETIKARLFEMLPGQTIEVRAIGDAVALSGTVSSSTYISRALAIAERHAPGKVTNLMAVQGSQQVMLAVRFAEVRRSTMKDIGFQNSFATSIGNLAFTLLTGIPAPAATFLTGLATYSSGKTTVNTLFDALEQKGVVKTLAEPTLIAMSGDTASFLAGGEFPVPVAQDTDSGGTTITVEFKQFGVSLAFTPTVLDNDLINLIVSPEVSSIDPAASVTINGFLIPGLKTRRATTTVELRDGQSFAIAGLIQSDFTDTVDQVPTLGDTPVLGALLRSSDFQQQETELVIIVTPYLVKPAPAGALTTPVESFVPPSEYDLFFNGKIEDSTSGMGASASGSSAVLNRRTAGGIQGPHGHIIQ